MSKERRKDDLRKEAQEPVQPSPNSGNLDEAIKAVYRRYGANLPAFFRDAYAEVARRESAESNIEVHTA